MGVHELKRYIIISCILILSAFLSYDIRSQGLDYGMELDEFDPYYNLRATNYLIENGHESYQNWHDDLSWYPDGRNVSATSQQMLHYTTAYTYYPFSSFVTLYDYTIFFPVIAGMLTVVPIFFLGRALTGRDEVGLISAFIFGILPMVLVRGGIGWFKSEPLGLLIGFTAIYFVVSGVNRGNIPRLIIGGLLFALGISAWGGIIFFLIPILIWIFMMPKKDYLQVGMGLTGFIGIMYLVGQQLGKVGNLVSEFVLVAFLFAIAYHFTYHKFGKKVRFVFIGIIIIGAVVIIPTELDDISNDRYMSILFPFGTSSALLSSVSEHQLPTMQHIIQANGIMLLLAPIGFVSIIKKKMNPFILILAILGIYVGISMIRLEIFTSIGLMFLSAVGIVTVFDKIKTIEKRKIRFAQLVFTAILIAGFSLILYDGYKFTDRPAIIIIEGGVWLDSLHWIKNNTPEDAKIMAWWDYGYWIETIGNRTTFMDNAAFHDMSMFANILTDEPVSAIQRLGEIEADYVLVYFIGFADSDNKLVRLGGGGDLAKLGWILQIGGRDDNIDTLNDNLYTMMIPYSTFRDDWYQEDNGKIQFLYDNGLELVHSSTNIQPNSRFDAVLIYKLI